MITHSSPTTFHADVTALTIGAVEATPTETSLLWRPNSMQVSEQCKTDRKQNQGTKI